jgi:sporulation protein YlmC with PRC-barrel domain
MKTMLWLTIILCVAGIGVSGCSRAKTPPAHPGPQPVQFITEDLLRYDLVDSDGTVIGPVDGMVVDTETGTTEYIVVVLEDKYNFGKGASHGPQNRFLLIPWSYLQLDTANQQLIVEAARLEAAPVLKVLPDTDQPNWDAAISQYWTAQ